jgi:hypothetical protein
MNNRSFFFENNSKARKKDVGSNFVAQFSLAKMMGMPGMMRAPPKEYLTVNQKAAARAAVFVSAVFCFYMYGDTFEFPENSNLNR